MISYFHRRKGNLGTCEDSLTAVVFDTLKYLPTEMFWSILKRSLYYDKLPVASGDLLSISFWDKWKAKDTTNSNFVEPDVFLRFNEFDVLIEAKRHNEKQQSGNQMKNEIQAYYNEFAADDKALYFIQLGGLHHINDELDYSFKDKNVIICKTNWTRLLDQIDTENTKIKNSGLTILSSYNRILEDAINGFGLHQYYKKRWLKNLSIKSSIELQPLEKLFSYATKHK
ncbi:hypothetical protein [Flavobacterium aquatile]|uniref:Restriction endonuclease n=1 Tax=Flavobacterium aquatile LMG 4008 = ATCC 11947 TaxID=1453498 RepID=A0A095SSI1_9FLAO|nr:hypothetical protein [Flavobacterium aquatile]KGD67571.1 hypothetical protein LG45_10550 [Flavobacterium aquatile LMG 4008 = ATCC 11947]OXA65560.1 hypothetical protein B0A61_14960 [Flavobacterium aquatile LMG 4008 = ATCC 11947]GEC80226.1 hypothetical protein FAQ01_30960 [Flavobacterium aquatile]